MKFGIKCGVVQFIDKTTGKVISEQEVNNLGIQSEIETLEYLYKGKKFNEEEITKKYTINLDKN
jgi:hypothetical protein